MVPFMQASFAASEIATELEDWFLQMTKTAMLAYASAQLQADSGLIEPGAADTSSVHSTQSFWVALSAKLRIQHHVKDVFNARREQMWPASHRRPGHGVAARWSRTPGSKRCRRASRRIACGRQTTRAARISGAAPAQHARLRPIARTRPPPQRGLAEQRRTGSVHLGTVAPPAKSQMREGG